MSQQTYSPLFDQSYHLHHPYADILVPGSFVVLQGMNGDGLRNTIDRLPELVIDETDDVETEEHEIAYELRREVTPGTALITQEQNPSLFPGSSQPSSIGMPSGSLGGLFPSVATAALAVSSHSMQLYSLHPLNLSSTASNATHTFPSSASAIDRQPPLRTTRSEDEDSFLVVGDDNTDEVSEELDHEHHVTESTPIPGSAAPWIAPHNVESGLPESRPPAGAAFTQQPVECPILGRPTSDAFPRPPSPTGLSMNPNPVLSEEQQRTLERWHQECRTHERMQRHEWCESIASTPDLSHFLQENLWWIDTASGRLKVYDALPQRNGSDSAVMGTLAPGTTVVAMELITLSIDTWQLVEVPSSLATIGVAAGQKKFSQGRSGWAQVLKIEQSASSQLPSPQSGYVVLSWNGYSYLAAGLPTQYVDPNHWVWRVTCPSGAYVREGLDLSTRRITTIPYGHLLVVDGKTVNAMGLSRLHVSYKSESGDMVTGWCSELLNPLSGQRGHIVQPLPMPTPALYRVVLSDGAVIRSGAELSSLRIGCATQNTVLSVTTRCFSEHPTDRCLQRLRLAGNGGWISLRLNKNPPEDLFVVELERVDESFEPNQPGMFHVRALLKVHQDQVESRCRSQQRGSTTTNQESSASRTLHQRTASSRLSPDVSSVDESADSAAGMPHGPQDASSASSASSSGDGNPSRSMYSPTAFQKMSSGNRSLGGGGNAHIPSKDDRCLICLCEERTATIVHGETGHIACCLGCARILKARRDSCPVCRLPIDVVIQHFWA